MAARLPFGALIAAISLCSCGQSSDNSKLIQINKGWERSFRFAEDINNRLYLELDVKKYDQESRYRVTNWIPCASRIRTVTAGIISYIGKLRSDTQALTKSQEAAVLDTVLRYKKQLLKAFDPVMFLRGDYIKKNIADFDKHLALNKDTVFFDKNPEIAKALLNALQSDIYLSEYELIRYCINQSSGIIESVERFDFIITQSSSYVKGGDLIKVQAGMGVFSLQSSPEIRIGGRKMKIDDATGTASTTFRAEEAPGKHSVVVKVRYSKPDGSTDQLTKKLEYTVAAP